MARTDLATAAPVVKKCRRVAKCPPRWTCRDCGAKCCEHMCNLKDSNGTAICGSCRIASHRRAWR